MVLGCSHQQQSQTHASTTDPKARIYRKANGSSRMAFMGHVLMENCYGLVSSARPPAQPSARRHWPRSMG